MIKNFRHQGLEALYSKGGKAGIQAKHVERLRLILARLDAACDPKDMNLSGLKLHKLTGRLNGFWAVDVSGIGGLYSGLKIRMLLILII